MTGEGGGRDEDGDGDDERVDADDLDRAPPEDLAPPDESVVDEGAMVDDDPGVDEEWASSGGASGGVRSDEEPLERIRDRVVDGDGEWAPPASFPAASTGDEDDGPVDDGDGTTDERPALEAAEDAGRSGPLGDLAADIDGRRERRDGVDDELFDEVEVGEVDADELWAQVESDEPNVTAPPERAIREIEKRKYCQGCPYFSTPPDVHCSHDGTEIIEQTDMDHFKVADCPVVLEDERLEDVTTD